MTPTEINYCIYCGALLEMQNVMGANRPTCPACGWIYFADPKVAVGVLVEQDSRVLLVKRINEPMPGRWTIPAGFVDAHEEPVHTAKRECLEETGLIVRIGDLLTVVGGREHPRGADIVIAYRAEVIGGELRPGDDASEVAFFSTDDLPPLAFRTTRIILGIE